MCEMLMVGPSGIHDPFLFDGLQVAGGEVLRETVSVTSALLALLSLEKVAAICCQHFQGGLSYIPV